MTPPCGGERQRQSTQFIPEQDNGNVIGEEKNLVELISSHMNERSEKTHSTSQLLAQNDKKPFLVGVTQNSQNLVSSSNQEASQNQASESQNAVTSYL